MPRIAIAQICPISAPPGMPESPSPSDPFPTLRANLAEVERVLESTAAVAERPDIVIFPEYFLQGILNEQRQYNSLPSKHLDSALIALAAKFGVAIVGTIVHGTAAHSNLPAPPDASPFPDSNGHGRAVETTAVTAAREAWAAYLTQNKEALGEPEGFTLYNEAFYIDSEGVKGRYHKLNLWHPEREYLSPGRQKFPVFDTPWGKAGFLICWDLSHPAEAQALAQQGADIIFAPMYWLGTDSDPIASQHNPDPNYELAVVQSLSYARSFETECVLVSCNAGGNRDRDGFMGGSGVWAPLLGKVGGFEGEEIGVRFVDVDMGILEVARKLYRIREDADTRCA